MVKVGEGQVLRYQRRQGITRCDGEAVYLFPEIYDFRTGRFRPVSRRPHGKGLAVIVARRLKSAHPATLSPKGPASSAPTTRAPAWHLNSFRPAAASTQAGDGGQASSLTAPMEIADGDPHTVWAEGRSSDGRGEWVTLRRPPSPYKLQRLRIIPGDASSPTAFAQGNRLASVLVVLSPAQRFRVRFPRDPLVDGGTFTDPYDIPLPTPSTTRCVTIVIERVYRGRGAPRGGGRTAIAEVKAITELDNAQGLRRLLKDLTGGDPHRAHVAATILARQKASILPTLKRAIAST
ncbi:MAG: hypothetical protein KAI47_15940, partial [Deltaproteobacteria bacterium]|nr:hypothetical protein [Deltaproteobacteria bacterium]